MDIISRYVICGLPFIMSLSRFPLPLLPRYIFPFLHSNQNNAVFILAFFHILLNNFLVYYLSQILPMESIYLSVHELSGAVKSAPTFLTGFVLGKNFVAKISQFFKEHNKSHFYISNYSDPFFWVNKNTPCENHQ